MGSDDDARKTLNAPPGPAREVTKDAAAGHAPTPASDIVMMDATALSDAIRARHVSCVEVMTAYLDHIDTINPMVNAIVSLRDRAALLDEARERDAELSRGEWMGPLHGFPHAAKDIQAVKGIPSTHGSPLLKNVVPEADCLMVERLRKAGAIIIGMTNVAELGLGCHTVNALHGATRNAYDQTLSAGGSSGGAAVAVATRMVPVADGTDYGGSLRNPAGWNNVFGFRTSVGRVPMDKPDVWNPSLVVTGPMARTVGDLAMLLSVQAGYDARVPLSVAGDGGLFAGQQETGVKGARIAWVGDFGGATPCEPGVLETCEAALKTFEALGCVVERARPDYPVEPVWRAFKTLRFWQQGGGMLPLYNDPAKRALLKPEAIYEIENGLKLSAFDITAASVIRSEWYQATRRFFERYDYLILPTAQVYPFAIDGGWPLEIAGKRMESYHEWMKALCLITMSGCPALAVPAGFDEGGKPIGLQIVGPNHGELACLRLAQAYDTATQWASKRPPPLFAKGIFG
jgi:amidase